MHHGSHRYVLLQVEELTNSAQRSGIAALPSDSVVGSADTVEAHLYLMHFEFSGGSFVDECSCWTTARSGVRNQIGRH